MPTPADPLGHALLARRLAQIPGALAGMLDGSLKTRPLIDEIVPLERTPYAFDRQASHDAMKVLVDMNA